MHRLQRNEKLFYSALSARDVSYIHFTHSSNGLDLKMLVSRLRYRKSKTIRDRNFRGVSLLLSIYMSIMSVTSLGRRSMLEPIFLWVIAQVARQVNLNPFLAQYLVDHLRF